MYDRVIAEERIADLVRQAEAHRRSGRTRVGRSRARLGAVARVRGALISAILWPIRH
jgi:hypothetical protein